MTRDDERARFTRLADMVQRWTGFSVIPDGDIYWYPRTRQLGLPWLRPEPVLHELCHWIVATPGERTVDNLALGWSRWADRRETAASLLEANIADAAGFDLSEETPSDAATAYENIGGVEPSERSRAEEEVQRALARFEPSDAFVQLVRALE